MRVATDHSDVILSAAARLFARKPFHEVLMDDVADSAGIAKGTIYRYFSNKDDLFAGLAFHYMEELASEIALVAGEGAYDLRLRRMLTRMAEIIQQRDDFFQVMQRNECNLWASKSHEFLKRREAIRAPFVQAIEDGIRSGLLQCPFDPRLAGDMLLGMIRSVLRFNRPPPPPEALAEMALHLFLRGLSAQNVGGSAK
jgi:AcrR family transcriptional regulator